MRKVCKQCGKEFDALRRSQKYCSRKCFQEATKTQFGASKTREDRIIVKIDSESPIVIAVLADVHNNLEYLEWVVEEVQKHDNWYIVINGDLWDADQFSSHPTLKVKSLGESVREVRDILLPIADRIIGFVWGNHEERCFRRASGKGTMPSYFDIFFESIKAKNPNFKQAEPMQGFIVEVTVKNKTWCILFKHGKNAGKSFGILEFGEVLKANDDVDAVVLSHIHLPLHMIVKEIGTKSIEEEEDLDGEERIVHLVRTTAGIAFIPYQDKGNMFVSPLGLTKLYFNSELKVKLR